MSAIAGVRKQIVYLDSTNMDFLIQTCIAGNAREFELLLEPADVRSLDAGLKAAADGTLRLFSDVKVVAMWRLVEGESAMHPRIDELLYQTGGTPLKE